MNLQLDHFSDVSKNTLKKTPRGFLLSIKKERHPSHTINIKSFLPLDKNKQLVEHGSHNVSRWMTWLSISLKNAAACDKWYQLQNHFITESLNANGAWEKPFVGHPRACHTQCRTNKKKKTQERKSFFPLSLFFFQNKSPGSGEAGVFVLPARPFGLVFAVSRALFFVRARSLAARLAQPNKTFLKKEKNIAFFFNF